MLRFLAEAWQTWSRKNAALEKGQQKNAFVMEKRRSEKRQAESEQKMWQKEMKERQEQKKKILTIPLLTGNELN